MYSWLADNVVGIFGIIIGAIIAYHVFFLSRSINFMGRLTHKENVRKRVEPLLGFIATGTARRVDLINVKKYLSHYPNSNEETRHGYTYLRAELKGLRFDGVDFFSGVREVYRKEDGTLSLHAGEDRTRENENALEAGLIPYEWIEYVDTEGDEYGGYPLFFTQFKGHKKSPYKSCSYYMCNELYRPGNDPHDSQWRRVDVEI
jgi:hypothetical protein